MDLSYMINEVQRSNIKSDLRPIVCKAVQEYYKILVDGQAIKPKDAVIVEEPEVKEVVEVKEPIVVEDVVEVIEPVKTKKKRSK